MGGCWSSDTTGSLNETLLGGNKYQDVQNIPGEPTDKKWYHGQISNVKAENRLRMGAKGNDGSYLVYDNPRLRGQYILLVYYKQELLRWKIQRMPSDGKYILGEDGPGVARYATVRELIKAHRGIKGKPIKLEGGGALTLSKLYVYAVDI